MTKTSKYLTIFGSVLLLVMALFHGSGLFYVTGLMDESNAPNFLKDIMPVLFAHPSIHLFGLFIFDFLSLSLGQAANKVLIVLAVLALLDGLLAFYLGGVIPGLLLIRSRVNWYCNSERG